MVKAVLLALLVGCGHNLIPQDAACAEQAELWCDRAGYPTDGCRRVYANHCGFLGDVAVEDQINCLAAIDDNRQPDREPAACVSTWTGR